MEEEAASASKRMSMAIEATDDILHSENSSTCNYYIPMQTISSREPVG
jgi:hypothetical protein